MGPINAKAQYSKIKDGKDEKNMIEYWLNEPSRQNCSKWIQKQGHKQKKSEYKNRFTKDLISLINTH